MTMESWKQVVDDYNRRGFFGRVGFGNRPAVLVVDLQIGFTDPTFPLGACLDDEIAANNQLLELARQKDIPVFFTVIGFMENLSDAGLWTRKNPHIHQLQLGGPWTEVDPRLNRSDRDPIIVKKFGSAFFGTHLQTLLVSHSIDTVILTGTSTSGCIRATAVDLLQNGYRAILPRECIGDRAPQPHDANLLDIDAKYGDVVALNEVLDYLERLNMK